MEWGEVTTYQWTVYHPSALYKCCREWGPYNFEECPLVASITPISPDSLWKPLCVVNGTIELGCTVLMFYNITGYNVKGRQYYNASGFMARANRPTLLTQEITTFLIA